ncbi:MAG: hypothetical protein JWL84_57 [Rhodospirillales bacterium]|nr:hypothetical protein [Rhodospirillales bacterium]
MTMPAGSCPSTRGTGVATAAPTGWQPEHDVAPGGASDEAALAVPVVPTARASRVTAAAARLSRMGLPNAQALFRSWFISGKVWMRLPVAAKMALSTAGAATAIVGSPTPPQNPPDGTSTASTCGISSIRMTL